MKLTFILIIQIMQASDDLTTLNRGREKGQRKKTCPLSQHQGPTVEIKKGRGMRRSTTEHCSLADAERCSHKIMILIQVSISGERNGS